MSDDENKEGILIVDDEENMVFILTELLRREGYHTYSAGNASEALKAFKHNAISLVITDLVMPGVDGLQLLSMLKKIDTTVPVILITAYGTIDTAVKAIKKGAYDYIVKPFDNEEILYVVKKAITAHGDRNKNAYKATSDKLLIGSSKKMEQMYTMINRIAESTSTVLIVGETGTGKELAAREIHLRSRFSNGPFVCVNCAALPDTLLESELFGYEKGAFTGAVNSKPGRFELTAGGTIFLDEIGDMSLMMQAKLLRVLQDKKIVRLGGTKEIEVEVRIITATNKDLETACAQGSFRQDLYYRINVLNIAIPPLREHKEDIPGIADSFVKYFCEKDAYPMKRLSEKVLIALIAHDWPGNIRELENVIARAVVLSPGTEILPDALGFVHPPQEEMDRKKGLKESVRQTTATLERSAIIKALKENKGNRSKTAKALGISRRGLLYKLKLYKLDEFAK